MSATAQPRYEFEKTEGHCPKKAWADARPRFMTQPKENALDGECPLETKNFTGYSRKIFLPPFLESGNFPL